MRTAETEELLLQGIRLWWPQRTPRPAQAHQGPRCWDRSAGLSDPVPEGPPAPHPRLQSSFYGPWRFLPTDPSATGKTCP